VDGCGNLLCKGYPLVTNLSEWHWGEVACCEGSANWGIAGIENGFGTIGKCKEKGAKGSITITSGCEVVSIALSNGPESNGRDIMEVVMFSPFGSIMA